jgi:integral membrane sensor domain MASE1
MNADDSWLDPEDSSNQKWVIRGVIGFIGIALILALYGVPYSNPVEFLIIVAVVFCGALPFAMCNRELCISLRGKKSSFC